MIRAAQGCGYAATHGRCDADDSAFSLFIEAFQELGRVIYQDTGELGCSPHDARMHLNLTIKVTRDAGHATARGSSFCRSTAAHGAEGCISRYNDLAYSGTAFK